MRAQDLLPDDINLLHFNDVPVRKGTVGAFLANARLWLNPAAPQEERDAAEKDIIEALPALQALGVFEFMSIRNPQLSELVVTHL
ncbi:MULTISPECIES: hypothetical protein [unclassified Phyllobacterium]|uniref:hypothetical protein n=1 Tax=Phyllobacterium TaxID=28100 RepID=UPI000DDC2B6F|nr:MULTISPECIES: hypothetical protein [unclassified Phyllobacterium]MBA8901179.1 hypothetical protein [Phyllobacterium sp. P30BS-XVII]UGX87879.1 hypothetical protein LLE53_008760 [Phyllobacterium sp. T1293]